MQYNYQVCFRLKNTDAVCNLSSFKSQINNAISVYNHISNKSKNKKHISSFCVSPNDLTINFSSQKKLRQGYEALAIQLLSKILVTKKYGFLNYCTQQYPKKLFVSI